MSLLTCTQDQVMSGLRAAAAIEALLSEEEWLRRYIYKTDWQPNVDLATFSNGGGDDMHILSGPAGIIIKGFDHESEVSPYANEEEVPWPGMFEGAPSELLALLDDPAINKDDITFLHWLPTGESKWQRGSVSFPDGEDDGSEWLLSMLPITATDYIESAKEYYEDEFEKIDITIVHQQFESKK